MLRHKHRMASHGCLLAIIGNVGGCQPVGNKVFCMIQNRGQAFLLQVLQVFGIQAKTRTKPGPLQRLEQLIDLSHAIPHQT